MERGEGEGRGSEGKVKEEGARGKVHACMGRNGVIDMNEKKERETESR